MTPDRERTGSPDRPRITPSYRPRQVAKTAPCQNGCPNCGDIRGWIGMIAQREKTGLSREAAFEAAWRTIVSVNPFPAVLGRVCPHPCEDHCNRNERDEPLAVNAMERFLGDWALEEGLSFEAPEGDPRPEWIGVVGAGPSGLSFAYQMARRGYRVTVYESRDSAGGMLRFGIPDYRLPPDVLDAELRRILDLGVELHLNCRVGRDVPFSTLRERHAALYIGIGAQSGRRLGIPGEDGPGVWTGTEYLERVNSGESIRLGDRVVVVGGGNTAIDAARTARRGGSRVTILYRRTREDMPAIAGEVEEAIEEGIELLLLGAPVRVVRGEDGTISELRALRMEPGPPDASGRRRPIPVPGSEFGLPTDAVVAAVSQQPVLEGLEDLEHEGGWLLPGSGGVLSMDVLAGGDALGLGIAAGAIVQGRHAAEALHDRLSNGSSRISVPDGGGNGRAVIPPHRVMLDSKTATAAAHPPVVPGPRRVAGGNAEVAGTISEAEFLREVERCYSCGSCFGCGQCAMYCTSGCYTPIPGGRPGAYFTLDATRCEECGKCIEVCPCGFLEST